jgi:hypothetical protein
MVQANQAKDELSGGSTARTSIIQRAKIKMHITTNGSNDRLDVPLKVAR